MIHGVTFTDVEDPVANAKAFARLPKETRQARIVCDLEMIPIDYEEQVLKLDGLDPSAPEMVKVLWLPVDSSDTASLSLHAYCNRYHEYCSSLVVNPFDTVEVNEVNGEWTGPPRRSADMADLAIDIINKHRRKSLLTLYQEGSDVGPLYRWLSEHWGSKEKRSVPTDVGISYYPRQGDGDPDFDKLFFLLGQWFPHSRLRWSELGTEKFDDNNQPVPATAEDVLTILANYYGRKVNHERFDGGYYWWSFIEQMVKGPFLPDLVARCV